MREHLLANLFLLFLLFAGVIQIGAWIGRLVDLLEVEIRKRWGPKPAPVIDAVDITNFDIIEHQLEGPILKRFTIYRGREKTPNVQRVKGPFYQMVDGALVKYSAEEVVTDMLIQYALSRQLGVNMTEEQAMRSLRDYFQIGIEVVREGQNVNVSNRTK